MCLFARYWQLPSCLQGLSVLVALTYSALLHIIVFKFYLISSLINHVGNFGTRSHNFLLSVVCCEHFTSLRKVCIISGTVWGFILSFPSAVLPIKLVCLDFVKYLFCSGVCPLVGFGISIVVPLVSTARVIQLYLKLWRQWRMMA